MRRVCSHCKVAILDNATKCPLCNGVLEGERQGETTYPNIIEKKKKLGFVLRLLLTLWVVAMVVLGIVSYYVPGMLRVVLLVGVCSFYALFMVWLLSQPEFDYMKRIYAAIIVGVILVISLDWILGYRGWSLDYVLPGGLVLLDVALIVLRLINRKNWQSYMVQQLSVIFLGIVPAVFIWLGWIQQPLVSVAAIALSVLLFVSTLIMGGRAARLELKRRFHVT